mmetsp:Transcript_9938/g.37046  ORF Transcript_9938/g.37046 Transcript_9938/m.37046 type:complete len:1293 (-) Transcript_9938:2208-6086(-)
MSSESASKTPVSPSGNPLSDELSLDIQLQQEYDKEKHLVAQKFDSLREQPGKDSSGEQLNLDHVSSANSTTVIGDTTQSVSVASEVKKQLQSSPHNTGSSLSNPLQSDEVHDASAGSPRSNLSSPEINSNSENMTRHLVNKGTSEKGKVEVGYHVIDRTQLMPQTDRILVDRNQNSEHIDTRNPREKYMNAEQSSDALLSDHNSMEPVMRDIMQQYNDKKNVGTKNKFTFHNDNNPISAEDDFFGEKSNPFASADNMSYNVDDLQQIVAQSTDNVAECVARKTVNRLVDTGAVTDVELGEHPHEKKSVQTSIHDLDENLAGISAHDIRDFSKKRHRLVGVNYQRVIINRKDDAIQTNPPKVTVSIVPQSNVLPPEFPLDETNRVIDCKYSALQSKVAEVERVRREKHKTESPIKDIKVRYDAIVPWEEKGLQGLCEAMKPGRVSILYGHGYTKYLHMILDLLLIIQSASFSLFAVKDSVVYDLNYLKSKPLAEKATKMEECVLDEVTGEPLNAVRCASVGQVEKLLDLIHIINGGDDSYQSVHLVAHIFTEEVTTDQDSTRSAPDLYIFQMADSQRPMFLNRRDELQGAFDSVHKQLTSLGIVLNALNTSRLRIPYHKSTITTMLKHPLDSMEYGIDIFIFLSSETHQVFENMHILMFTKAVAQSGIGTMNSRIPSVDIDLLKHENTLLQSEMKVAKAALPNEFSVACNSIQKNNEDTLTDKKIGKIATKIKQEIQKNVKKMAGVEKDANSKFKAYKNDQDTFHSNRIESIKADILRIKREIDEHTSIHNEKFTHLTEQDCELSKNLELLHSEMEQLTMQHQMLENSISREENDVDLLSKKFKRLQDFDANREENVLEESDDATHEMRVKLAGHSKNMDAWKEEFANDQYLIETFNKNYQGENKYETVFFSYSRQQEYEDRLKKILNRTLLLTEHSFVQNLMNMTDEQLKELQVRNFQLRQELKEEESKMLELDVIKEEQLENLVAEGRTHAHSKLAEFIRWKNRTLMAFVQKGTFMRKITEQGKSTTKFFWIRMDDKVPILCCCGVIDNIPHKDRITKTINLSEDVVEIQLGQCTPRFQRYFRRSEAGAKIVSKKSGKRRKAISNIFSRKGKFDEFVEPTQIARESSDFHRSFTIVYKKKRKFLDLVVEKGNYEFWLLALRDLTGILPTHTFPVPVEDSDILTNDELECCSRNHIPVKGLLDVKESLAKREPYDTITVVDVKQASDRINIIHAYHLFQNLFVPNPDVVTMVEMERDGANLPENAHMEPTVKIRQKITEIFTLAPIAGDDLQ